MDKPAIAFSERTEMSDPVLTAGRYKGERLSAVSREYLRWLANPGEDRSGRPYKVDPAIQAAAQARIAADNSTFCDWLMAGRDVGLDTPAYVIEREGDIDGRTAHRSLADALAWLADEYPVAIDDIGEEPKRQTPDPEDDRITIWEVLESGHRKVCWHFSGWHHDAEEFGLQQGSLPGDDLSLYSIAMIDL